MVEPVVTGLISTAIAKGSIYGVRTIRDAWQRAEFPLDVEDTTAEFTRALQDELESVARENDSDELASFVEEGDWQAVAHALDEDDEDGGLTIPADEEKAVTEVAEAISRAAGIESETASLERELREAAAAAYGETLASFEEAIAGTDVADEWGFQNQRALLSHLDDVKEAVGELLQRAGPARRYEVYDADSEGFQQAASDVDVEEVVEFVTRPELEDEPSSRKVLLAGWGGSGKSRALMELLERFPDREHDLEHVVRMEDEFLNTGQIDPLENEPFNGDVLLVWDDVHRLDPESYDGTFQSAVRRLEAALQEDGHQLHVLATARTEGLERLPDEGSVASEGPWEGFRPVTLDEYEELFLGELVDHAMDHFGVDSPDAPEDEPSAEEALTEVATGVHPSPFYVVSVVQIARQRGGELTPELVAELPEEVRELWENERDNLADEDPEAYEILRAIRLLREFFIPLNAGLVRGVAREVFDCHQFVEAVRRLDRKEWISTTDDVDPTDADAWYTIHDLKVAVVELAGAERQERVESLSGFMLNGLEPHVPDDGEELRRIAHGNLANALSESPTDRFRELAEWHYDHILKHIRSNDVKVHSNYGNLLKEQGRYEEAEAEYEAAIEADPDYAKAHSNYGLLLDEQGRYEEAEAEYEAAIEADPDLAEAHSNYGVLLKEQGRYEEAEAEYEAAIEADPDYAEAHSNYGLLLKEQERYDEAEAEYEAAIEANPDLAEAHSNYGVLLDERGRYDEAEAEYEAAIEADPDYVEAHHNYGLLLQEQGQCEEAGAHYEAAIDADPHLARTRDNYASILHEQNELREAREHVETSVERWRQQGNTGNALEALHLLVRVCENLDDTTAAIDNAILALELANRADEEFGHHVNWFGPRCLEHLEDGVPADVKTTYDWALRAVRARIGDIAFPLFENLWNAREDTDDDTTEALMTNAASVAYAAHLDYGFDSDGDDEPSEILQTVTPTHLPPAPKSLYDLLALEYPDVDLVPDDETDEIEPLHEDEDAAFGRLMALVG